MTSFGGSPGEGTFTLKVDRRKLGPIVPRQRSADWFSEDFEKKKVFGENG